MIQSTILFFVMEGFLHTQERRIFMITKTFTSQSLDDTAAIAQEILGEIAVESRIDGATVLALSGDLGAGKTAFTKACAQHLGISETVVSPTFVIAKFYEIPGPSFPWKHLVHIDAYRLESWSELEILKFDDVFRDPKNLVIIEWPEQVTDQNQEHWKKLNFTLHGEEREIVFVINPSA